MEINKHVSEFLQLLETHVNVLPYIKNHQQLVIDGEKVATFLLPIITKDLTSFNLSSAPLEMRSRLQKSSEAMIVYGVMTHCLLFECKWRGKADSRLDLKQLEIDWVVQSVTAISTLKHYDKDNQGIPNAIFNATFEDQVEPLQKKMGIGWWRRIRNRSKFYDLFASGICLGLIYDVKSSELHSN